MTLLGTKTLKLNGNSISGAFRRGSGTPVLLLHGNSSCKEVFSVLWQLLDRQEREVLAIDLPGHGSSQDAEDPEATYTLPGYSRMISAVVDDIEWRSAIVIGWSLGGHIALQTMVDDRRIKGAFVIGTPPGKPSIEAFEAAFNADPITRLAGAEAFSDDDALQYTRAMLGVDNPEPFLIAAAKRTDGRARSRMMQSVAQGLGADQREAYADGDRSVAVIVGEHDPFLKAAYLHALEAGRLWQGKVHRLPNEGHAPHHSPSAEFAQLLNRFLDENSAGP